MGGPNRRGDETGSDKSYITAQENVYFRHAAGCGRWGHVLEPCHQGQVCQPGPDRRRQVGLARAAILVVPDASGHPLRLARRTPRASPLHSNAMPARGTRDGSLGSLRDAVHGRERGVGGKCKDLRWAFRPDTKIPTVCECKGNIMLYGAQARPECCWGVSIAYVTN